MEEAFAFNARQYFDFNQEQEDLNGDSFFENDPENACLPSSYVHEEVVENEMSDTESDCFFSPMDRPPECSNSTIYLKSRLRKSLSMSNLPIEQPSQDTKELDQALNEIHLVDHEPPRPSSACSYTRRGSRAPSQEHINRLAQPKKYTSHDNLSKSGSMTLAEAVNKFQAGTPKRFRSRPSPRVNKAAAPLWGNTVAHSPKLRTNARIRPVSAISHDEQERREVEEAKKFKIKAHPVNRKVLKGPLKPQIDKKPLTAIEPFKLTEIKKKEQPEEEKKVPVFKAQPLPKSLHNPFKVQAASQPPTKAQTPRFSKRLTRPTPNKVEEQKKEVPKPFKPTHTEPKPFSFDKRDQELQKRKEELLNKVLEEERKMREFHAKPPPKSILRARNSQDQINETGTSKSFKRSTEELDSTTFKARPATVLLKKPFEPKKDENHTVVIEEFHLKTDQRLQERHKFEEELKEKQALVEQQKRQQEEMLRRLEEEEVMRLRKQMEVKAQPIKKYKEVKIQPANKVTEPISPKFHTDKLRNKENIQH